MNNEGSNRGRQAAGPAVTMSASHMGGSVSSLAPEAESRFLLRPTLGGSSDCARG